MKKCICCYEEKPMCDFYKHKGMSDGHLNKCKECITAYSRKRHELLSINDDWMEKERKRSRERYYRLNYKDRQKQWDKNKPWKNTSVYKNLSRDYQKPKGLEFHHWNYNNDFLNDFFCLTKKDHRFLHKYLILDLKKKIFLKMDGEYLDSKEKHLLYMKSILQKDDILIDYLDFSKSCEDKSAK